MLTVADRMLQLLYTSCGLLKPIPMYKAVFLAIGKKISQLFKNKSKRVNI